MHILYIRQVQQPSLVLYEENCGKRLLICRATEAWQQRTQPVISQFFPWKVLVQLYIGSECTKEGYFSCCGLRYVSLYHLKIRGPIGLCKTVTLVRIDRHQLGWKLHRSLLNAAVSSIDMQSGRLFGLNSLSLIESCCTRIALPIYCSSSNKEQQQQQEISFVNSAWPL